MHTHARTSTHTDTHAHARAREHTERLNVTRGGFIPSKCCSARGASATHHNRSEGPSPLRVDGLFEAPPVVSRAQVKRRQLLVAARDAQPADGAERRAGAGAVRGAEIRHYHIIIINSAWAGPATRIQRARAAFLHPTSAAMKAE